MENQVSSAQITPRNWPNYIAIIIATISIIISGLTFYFNIFKSFDLKIYLNPEILIQHKGNLGFYVFVNFYNNSPKNGSISQTAMVIYKNSSPEDKYLFTFEGFREADEKGVYGPSEEKLPLFLKPWGRETKALNFIYTVIDEQFPISMGTYICELYFWIDNADKPSYKKEFRFDLSADILDLYKERRDKGSTMLSPPIKISGYAPLSSRKLKPQEYKQLF